MTAINVDRSHTQAMTTTRMPAAIVGAIVVLAGCAAFAALNAAAGWSTTDIDTQVSYTYTVFALAFAFAAVGVWRHWIPGMVIAVAVSALTMLAGLYFMTTANLALRLTGYDNLGLIYLAVGALAIGLVVVPQSSRSWFH